MEHRASSIPLNGHHRHEARQLLQPKCIFLKSWLSHGSHGSHSHETPILVLPLSLLSLSLLSLSRGLSQSLAILQSRNLLCAGPRRGITSSASASTCPFKLTIRSRSCSKAWPRSFSTRARRTNFTSFSTGYQSPFVPEKHINPGFICLIYFFDVLPDEYTGETMKIGSMLWLTTR